MSTLAETKRYLRAFVQGNSMLPTLCEKSLVIIDTEYDFKGLSVGDIVAFRDSVTNQIFIHRIKIKYETQVVTCGDNRNSNDPEIGKDQILGTLKLVRSAKTGVWRRPKDSKLLADKLYSLPFRFRRFYLRVYGSLFWETVTKKQGKIFLEKTFSLGNKEEESESVRKEFESSQRIVYDQKSGKFHLMNESAYLIYRSRKRGEQVVEIVGKLMRKQKNVSREVIRRDVDQTISQMKEIGLLT